MPAFRQPEYTGENRCVPCTAVNVVIAFVLAAGAAFVTTTAVGVVLFFGCVATIYFRGYLVPGTPTLTERYLPRSILGLFGKDVGSDRTIDDRSGDDWTALEAAGIATRSGTDTLRLEEKFRRRLRRELHESRTTPPTASDVARIVDAEEVTKRGPRTFSIDGRRLLEWDSDAALVADVAASTVLESWIDDWEELDRDRRRTLLRRLRLLLERCPACDGAVERECERVDPCCQPAHVFVWAQCTACGERLAEEGVPDRNADELTAVTGFDDGVAAE